MKNLNLFIAIFALFTFFSMNVFAGTFLVVGTPGDSCSENSTSVLLNELEKINSGVENQELTKFIDTFKEITEISDPVAGTQEFNKIIGKEPNENSLQALKRKLNSIGLPQDEVERIMSKLTVQNQRD